MKKSFAAILFALAAAPLATPVAAQTKLDFILNWVPGGDHAPYYYAKKLGWYQKEGLDVNLGRAALVRGVRHPLPVGGQRRAPLEGG